MPERSEAGRAPSVLERMELAFRSLGSFFLLLADACFRWAGQLAQVVVTLNQVLPSWRTLPGMS